MNRRKTDRGRRRLKQRAFWELYTGNEPHARMVCRQGGQSTEGT